MSYSQRINQLDALTTASQVIALDSSKNVTQLAYSPSAIASSLVQRDANGNFAANNISESTTGNAAVGTITLTAASSRFQIFASGAGTATCVMPDATTLTNGWIFELNNNASGNITVNANGGGLLFTMIPGSYARVILLSNSFPAGQWDYHWLMPQSAKYGTAGLTVTGTMTATNLTTTSGVLTYNGTNIVASTAATIDASNYYTNTAQPLVSAYNSTSPAGVTGDGTVYTIICDQAPVNQSSSYNTSTGIFTAPKTGNYLICGTIGIAGIGALNTAMNVSVVSTAKTYIGSEGSAAAMRDANNNLNMAYSKILPLTSGNTLSITLVVAGASKNINIHSDPTTPITWTDIVLLD